MRATFALCFTNRASDPVKPAAVDPYILARLAVPAAALAALRKAGASSPEVILSSLLSPRLRVRPPEVLAKARSGEVSWDAARPGRPEAEGDRPAGAEVDALIAAASGRGRVPWGE